MNKVWPWIAGIVVCMLLIALLFVGTSNKADYWVARGVVARAIQVTEAENITLIRFPCGMREGSILTAKECGFYVWKK
jgi:cell division protein FtsW (lipid II flippase)